MTEIASPPAFTSQPPLSSGLLTTLEAVQRLAPAWEALLERSSCHRAFASPAWFIAGCRATPGLEPRLVVAWRGTELVGVLPLAQAQGTREARFPTRLGDYNDIVGLPGDVAVAARLLVEATSAGQPYDRLVLRMLRADSNCLPGVAALLPEGAIGRRRGSVCSYVQLPATFDSYLAGRSAKFRKTLRHAERRAARHGLEVRTLAPGELAAQQVPEIFLGLHRSRFGSEALFATPPAERFARAVLPQLFASRRLLLLGLFQGGALLALDLCLRGADSLGVWNGGFVPAAAAWSPGRLLAAAGIRAAMSLGCREYDLLRGDQPWKARWATHQRELTDLELPAGGGIATAGHQENGGRR
jgi:CelD/BcsL family acetyltransferase involved in cellulose biosynthesis